jgi:hypothetical protein
MKKIKRFFNNIYLFFFNIWLFRKELWEYRWWDYEFIFILIRKHLEHAIPKFEKQGKHENVNKQVYSMKKAKYLLDKLLSYSEHSYLEEACKINNCTKIIKNDWNITEKKVNNNKVYQYERKTILTSDDLQLEKDTYLLSTELEKMDWDELIDTLKGIHGYGITSWWD